MLYLNDNEDRAVKAFTAQIKIRISMFF